MKDSVYIEDTRPDGLLIARYGKDSKRSNHVCCPRCTNAVQIYPMVASDEILICIECGLAVKEEVKQPGFFVFRSGGGKQHLSLEFAVPPVAITGREFNAGGIEYDDKIEHDELCSLCSRRYEREYGPLNSDNLLKPSNRSPVV